MLFTYKATDASRHPVAGGIDALNIEIAIGALQRRGFILSSIAPAGRAPLLSRDIFFWRRVRGKDIVIFSRQLATLFEAQVSALRIFRLLSSEITNPLLREAVRSIGDDIQAGSSIHKALGKHKDIFSHFYVQMVRSGEESGKLSEAFLFLADYLERAYELTAKARNALVYPILVLITFVAVMVLMLTTVIPSVSAILVQSGLALPIYTRVILWVSAFFVSYGWLLLILLAVGALFLWRFAKTPQGEFAFAEFKLRIPYIGTLFRSIYLSRISDNLHTQLSAAIPIVEALETTKNMVDNAVFAASLSASVEAVKGGASIASAFEQSHVIPGMMVQMIRVGEESGEIPKILETLARFYRREVQNAVEMLISLIEPALIVALGLGIGFLLAAVLVPIYSISGAV